MNAKAEAAKTLQAIFGYSPEDEGTSDALEQIGKARRRAEACALRILSERECPETVREFGRRHRIENFAEQTWIDGFQAGMRVALLSEPEEGGR